MIHIHNGIDRSLVLFRCRYDHPHILSGQGTMGLEIADQVQNIDAVVIPVGGAGLLAGCAVALKTLCPNIMVIVSDFNFF